MNYRYYNPNYIISGENVRNLYLRLYYQEVRLWQNPYNPLILCDERKEKMKIQRYG